MARSKTTIPTRDLLMMAALAALGGVSSTYINTLGDALQSVLGFAGTMQWAAGLHVLWLTLAVGLTGRVGAGTITGVLKGAVELLSGNTHGLLILLVDLVAGLLVDLGFAFFRDRDALLPHILAGGLGAASNVLVFQLFASLPADMLAYGAILLVAGVAFGSGALFAGLLGRGLVSALRRAGVVKDRPPIAVSRWVYPLFFAATLALAVGLGLYLREALRGPATISVTGAVAEPFNYPAQHGDIAEITAGAAARYTGIPVRELIARAEPASSASLLLIQATDGYAFFVSMDEIRDNDALLLSCQGKGDDASCNIVGARNSKAQVRAVAKMVVIAETTIEITGELDDPSVFDPDDWQFEMDSIRLDVGQGAKKVQGAPLGKVILSMSPRPAAQRVVVATGQEPVTVPLQQVTADDDIRIFTLIGEQGISFALADMHGNVLAPHVTGIQVQGE